MVSPAEFSGLPPDSICETGLMARDNRPDGVQQIKFNSHRERAAQRDTSDFRNFETDFRGYFHPRVGVSTKGSIESQITTCLLIILIFDINNYQAVKARPGSRKC
jgi:hypothetical protein